MLTSYLVSTPLVPLEIPKSFSSRHILQNLLFTMIFVMVWIPTTTMAFKLETHVWIAQQVLNDVVPDGKVTISPFGDFSIDPLIADALLRFANEYRLGSIGPDAFQTWLVVR